MTRHSPPAGAGTRDPDAALTPEERALAERIARATSQHAPSAALDARILALAQEAMTVPDAPVAPVAMMPPATRTPPPHARSARRRWPAAFGIAATLALAVGLAWQLRPLHDMQDTASETVPAAVADQATAAGAAPAVAARAGTAPGDTASMATPPTQDAAAGRDAATAAADDDAAAPGVAVPAAVTATAVTAPADMAPSPPVAAPPKFDNPSPAAAAPPPPPPVPAAKPQLLPQRAGLPPPAPAAQAFSAAPATGMLQDSDAQAATTGREHRAEAADAASPRAAAKTAAAAAAPPSPAPRAGMPAEEVDRVFTDQPLDAEPPASADSPQVQQAWLKRVRELLAQGKREIARDSLREYQRRYPQAPLPDDLRALLE